MQSVTVTHPGLSALQLDREGVRARVAAHLATKRPIEELGVERNRPADTKDFAFVGMAPKRSSQQDWYRCSFCQRDRQFAAGRIVLSSDSLLRLIGDDCWDKHLDKTRYAEEREDWDAYRRRQEFEKIRERVGPAATAVATCVRKVLQEHEALLQFVEGLPRILRERAPVLRERLQAAARRGGQLQVERVVHDYATGGNIFQFETVHRVSGIGAVLEQPPPLQDTLRNAVRMLYQANNIIQETDWSNIGNRKGAKVINDLTGSIGTALKAIDVSREAVGEARRFLSRENLAGIVRWRADKDCELHLDDDALFELVPDGLKYSSEFVLVRPSALQNDVLPDASELKRLLNLAG